MMNLLYLNF